MTVFLASEHNIGGDVCGQSWVKTSENPKMTHDNPLGLFWNS